MTNRKEETQMGYSVDLMDDALFCKSREDAERAAAIVNLNEAMHPYHLGVHTRVIESGPDAGRWYLEIAHFQGDHWYNEDANALWLALAPHLADGAYIEFMGEGHERWRVRWQEGRVYEEYVTEVIWAVNTEIILEQEEVP